MKRLLLLCVTYICRRSYFTYEELKHLISNVILSPFPVHILPMRNWNFFIAAVLDRNQKRSYFTYEELKLSNYGNIFSSHNSSYFTYEELKPIVFFSSSPNRNPFIFYLWGIETSATAVMCPPLPGSYFTYEELKQRWWNISLPAFERFIFYLWGIETEALCEKPDLIIDVHILPMRNWN